MNFQTVLFFLNTPGVSDTTLCHWDRGCTVFVRLFGFFILCFQIKTLCNGHWKSLCLQLGSNAQLQFCSVPVFTKGVDSARGELITPVLLGNNLIWNCVHLAALGTGVHQPPPPPNRRGPCRDSEGKRRVPRSFSHQTRELSFTSWAGYSAISIDFWSHIQVLRLSYFFLKSINEKWSNPQPIWCPCANAIAVFPWHCVGIYLLRRLPRRFSVRGGGYTSAGTNPVGQPGYQFNYVCCGRNKCLLQIQPMWENQGNYKGWF